MDKIGNIALLAIICTAVITVKQVEAGACDNNPCQNGGNCAEDSTSTGGFTCTCPIPFGGANCTTNYCLPNPCVNGGTCGINLSLTNDNAWGCSCPAGYGGDTCADEDACHPNPCQNDGSCIDPVTTDTTYSCICASGFIGVTCDAVAGPGATA